MTRRKFLCATASVGIIVFGGCYHHPEYVPKPPAPVQEPTDIPTTPDPGQPTYIIDWHRGTYTDWPAPGVPHV